MGIILVLFFKDIFLIKSQPHIIASLLAIRIFLLFFIKSMVNFKPAIPGIAVIVMSEYFRSLSFNSKSEIIVVLLYLNLFFIFFKVS